MPDGRAPSIDSLDRLPGLLSDPDRSPGIKLGSSIDTLDRSPCLLSDPDRSPGINKVTVLIV